MPKPVSVACLISALPGPLAVNATASDLSVQPASGHDYPRLFIATGKLILGFGVAGPSAKALEYSELLSDSLSVKGEIPMPVTAELEASTPFDRIRSQTGSGTTCVGCHSGEKAAPASIGATAYSSKALRPMSHQDVSLTELAKLRDAACANTADPRCAVLKALWKAGDPKAYTFPAAMPTMF